jgi:myo-inositol 2-dehydrogenase / D-chiro-inositol 1-dehydrogenase
MESEHKQSRRAFLTKSALGVAGIMATANFLSSCGKRQVELNLPPLLKKAPDGEPLKAGLVGCGGRGTGAAINFLNAGPNLTLAAMADVFNDRMAESRKKIHKQTGQKVPDEQCFIGFDAYRKVIESGVDVVILATPPYFRPLHFAACVDAHKHVFMEKPLAVDPVGIRSIITAGKRADSLGLTVVTGTQRHHQKPYIEAYKRVMQGEIGDIVAANCYWNSGQLWYKERKPGWSDMEFMIRDWVNWSWLSGDHIIEQHVHNIDVINWFMGGKFPVKAVGVGSRQRRVTGDQFDNFSVDFTYEGDIHMHSMCRQIDGCANNVSEFVRGTKGYSDCRSHISNAKGEKIWFWEKPEEGDKENSVNSPYLQEHIHLVTAIRRNEPFNEAEFTAKSTLTAIMGRIAAYTGKEVTWEQMMKSNLQLGPEGGPESVTALGSSKMINSKVPVPGAEKA